MNSHSIIVCAKKESERLPGKNLRPLNGKPLIEYTFDYITNNFNMSFKNVWVVSDSPAILHLADRRGFGTMREPEEYVNNTHNMPLMRWIDKNLRSDKYIMLPPTSPVRSIHLIDCIEDFLRYNYRSAHTVYSPQRSQYMANGAVFMWSKYILETEDIIDIFPRLYVDQQGFDIDTKADFDAAEKYIMEKNK